MKGFREYVYITVKENFYVLNKCLFFQLIKTIITNQNNYECICKKTPCRIISRSHR